MKKYELIKNETITKKDGTVLYRIKSIKDFSDVKAGDLGGYVESEENLSQEGNCWVYGDAKVYGKAKVYDNAKVYGTAEIYENAEVYDDAKVYVYAMVHGNAKVYINAMVHGSAEIYGNAQLYGFAEIYGNAKVYEYAKVCGNAEIYENAKVYGDTIVYENAKVYGSAEIRNRARGNVAVFGNTHVCCGGIIENRNINAHEDIQICKGELRRYFIVGSLEQSKDINEIVKILSTQGVVVDHICSKEGPIDRIVSDIFDRIEKSDVVFVLSKSDNSLEATVAYPMIYARRIGKKIIKISI